MFKEHKERLGQIQRTYQSNQKELLMSKIIESVFHQIQESKTDPKTNINECEFEEKFNQIFNMALGIVNRHKIQNVKIKLNHLHNYVDNVILKKQKMGLLKCQSDPILISGTKIHQPERSLSYSGKKLNQFILKCSQNQVQIENLTNLCCSQFLYSESKIKQSNKVIMVQSISMLQQFGCLEETICAALNNLNGSYILIGIDKNMRIKGVYLTQNEKEKVENIFAQKLQCLRPRLQSKQNQSIKFIPVLNHPLRTDSAQDLQIGRYVICMQFISDPGIYGYLVQENRQGFHTVFKTFITKNSYYTLISGQQIYQHLMKNINSKQYRKHCHYHSKCKKPKQDQRLKLKEKNKEYHEEQRQQEEQIQLKFRNNSLLIVNSQNKEPLIIKLISLLDESKMKFQYYKPFLKYTKKTGRVTYLISHEDTFQSLNNYRRKIQKGIPISFFSCTKNLKIDLQVLENNEKIQQFSYAFKKQCPKAAYKIQNKIDEGMQNVYFRFGQYEQAIFSFIFLDNIGVRSHFVKDSEFKQKK